MAYTYTIYEIKGEGGVSSLPPPPPAPTTLMEWMKFKDILWTLLSVTLGPGFIKFIEGGGGGGDFNSVFYSVKLYVIINYCSLRHNVFCFSFVVLCTPSRAHMQLLKWFSLMKEIAIRCHMRLRLKKPLKVNRTSEFIEVHNFDIVPILAVVGGGGNDNYLKSDFQEGGITKKNLILPWKSRMVVVRVAHAKPSDPATPPKKRIEGTSCWRHNLEYKSFLFSSIYSQSWLFLWHFSSIITLRWSSLFG